MRTQNGTTTVKELAILASSCGLVEKSEHGRQAFAAWFANDPKAARKELFTRVAARRVTASAAKAQTPATKYPGGWLRAAGVGGRRGTGARVTEGRD